MQVKKTILIFQNKLSFNLVKPVHMILQNHKQLY